MPVELGNNEWQTFGEKAVWKSFNPSKDSKVDAVKSAFATIIDMIHEHDMLDDLEQRDSYMKNTLRWMAIRACITAQMACVKFLTWKD